jgi:hypothetical protein
VYGPPEPMRGLLADVLAVSVLEVGDENRDL